MQVNKELVVSQTQPVPYWPANWSATNTEWLYQKLY